MLDTDISGEVSSEKWIALGESIDVAEEYYFGISSDSRNTQKEDEEVAEEATEEVTAQ